MFCGLPGLKDLYLGDNQLKSIDFDFGCIKQLRFLDLQYNKIKRLDGHTMQQIDNKFGGQKRMQINLIQNPWVCDCKSIPFYYDLTPNSPISQSLRNALSDSIICQPPANLLGKYIDDVALSDLNPTVAKQANLHRPLL